MTAPLRISILFYLIASALALTSSTWRPRPVATTFPRSIASSRAPTVSSSLSGSVPTFFLPAVSPPRLVTTFLSSSSPEKFDALEKKIGALEHLLKGGNSATAPEDIRESVLIYEGDNKDWLRGILKAIQEEKTALIISKTAVESKGLAPPRVDDFSAVWNAIVNHPIVENQENPRLWSLHGGIKWIGGVQELYNRPCYDEITNAIFSLTHALVFGTPGIGKTLYLQALLVHIFRRAKEEGLDIPTIHYIYTRTMKVTTVSFLPDGSVVDISDVLRPPRPDYLLSDSVDLDVALGKVLTLEVASGKESNYNNFQKRVDEARGMGRSLVMPVFSFHEIQSIQPADMNDFCAEFRHDVFGGSARNFISVQERIYNVLPVVDETLTRMFPDVKEKHHDAWVSVARQVSAQLTRGKTVDDKIATVNSMMWHMLPDGSKTWSSKFMEWLAAAIFDDRTADIVGELERVIGKAGVGNLFEAIGHRKLVRSTMPFRLKPLSKSLPPTKPAFERAQFNLTVVRFKTVAEIRNLPNGMYGLPMDNNFPVVDAVIQPDTLVQFTTSPEQHEGSLLKLADIRALLRASPTDHRIIFVIPPENIKTFRYHPKLEGIRQLVCVADPLVVDERSLMNAKEKMAWNFTVESARRTKVVPLWRWKRKDLKDPPGTLLR